MARPIIRKILPFDAAVGTTIEFSWAGVAQAKNRLQIWEYDSTDANLVYNVVRESFRGQHIIAPNSGLVNGKRYRARLRIESYSAGAAASISDPSDYSIEVPFYCFTTPTFSLVGLKTPSELGAEGKQANVLNTSNVIVNLNYAQIEDELLNTWRAELLNASREVIQSTGELYAINTTQTYFSGLEDEMGYFVRATGTTVNGMVMETDEIPIHIDYELPDTYIQFTVENNAANGRIDLNSYIVSLVGKQHPEEPPEIPYIEDNATPPNKFAGDLTKPYYVLFGENPEINGALNLSGDFTLRLKAKAIHVIDANVLAWELPFPENIEEEGYVENLLLYNAFLVLMDSSTGARYTFTLWRNYNKDGPYYQIFLYCNNPEMSFGLWSNTFYAIGKNDTTGEDEWLYLIIQRSSNLFSMKAIVR